MPSTSKRQAAFMRAVAHNKGFAKKTNVPQKVGRDFAVADKGKDLSKLPLRKGAPPAKK